MSEYLPRTLGDAGGFTGRSISNAGLLVDFHEIIFIGDRTCRAGLDAHFAADTTNLADGLDIFTQILCRTRDENPRLERLNFDDALGARSNTNTAAHAFIRINNREILDHVDGAKGAGFGAFTKTDAGILACGWSAKVQIGGSARGKTIIFMLMTDTPFDSGTTDHGNLILNCHHFLAGQFRHPVGHLFFSGKTKVRWNIGIGDHGNGVTLTARKAATTALGKGQGLKHMLDQRVDLHGEFMSSNRQTNPEKQADTTKQNQTT